MTDKLGINHQSPLIYWRFPDVRVINAGNQSPIPFDILRTPSFRQKTAKNSGFNVRKS